MVLRRSLCALFALLAIGLAACGGADEPTRVASGLAPSSDATVSSTSEVADLTSTTAPAAQPEPATTDPAATPVPTTTTTPASGSSAASPVAGLDAAELQAALVAPGGATGRSSSGAVVDRVTLADGTRVWRVRVPGAFAARSARVAVTVGDRRVGEAVLAPDLQAIVAVTTDGSGLSAGRPVSYQWEGGPSVPAGTLAVVR